ncbi:MAG: leucine-rich repeat protein [Prevotellaceae bacterium]|jgi:hypothetical protein|nr:leucine-rich repeat protein [Prevotellaceae bacterium]
MKQKTFLFAALAAAFLGVASFATVQAQIIDEFPYTVTITSNADLPDWNTAGASIYSDGARLYGGGSGLISPELDGAFMTITLTSGNASGSPQMQCWYSTDGVSFSSIPGATTISSSNTTRSFELPLGTKFIKIHNTAPSSNYYIYLKSITITNDVASKSDSYQNITWELKSTGELIIGGTGNMPDFANTADVPWYNHAKSIGKLTFGSGITSIGNNSFRGMALKSIIIPNNITKIGNYAFAECYAPTSLYIHNNITSIGDYAFYDMDNLDYVEIGTGLKSVGTGAFSDCLVLSSFRFNAVDCRVFGDEKHPVFAQSYDMRSFLFGSTVKTIPDYMFAGMHMSFRLFWQNGASVGGYDESGIVELPPTVKYVGMGAFLDTRFTDIIIPASVDTVGAEAFRDNTSLESLRCNRTVPPVLKGDLVFHNINKGTCYLVVPQNSYSAYSAAAQWKDFFFIVDPSYSVARLNSLSINGAEFDQGFDPEKFSYTLTVPYEVSRITINAMANADVTVSDIGEKELNVGLNLFHITVVAPDKQTTQIYTIAVTRLSNVSGIEPQTAADTSLQVYPNPVLNGELNVKNVAGGLLQLFDCSGRVVLSKSVTGGDAVIEMSSISEGIYILRNGENVVRVVKRN